MRYAVPSTDQVMELGFQSTANVWNASANDQFWGCW